NGCRTPRRQPVLDGGHPHAPERRIQGRGRKGSRRLPALPVPILRTLALFLLGGRALPRKRNRHSRILFPRRGSAGRSTARHPGRRGKEIQMNLKPALPAIAIALALAMSHATSEAAPISAPAVSAPGRTDTATARPPGMALDFSAVLQVEEADKVSSRIIARAESLGGWFSQRGKTTVRLRIPTAAADGFIRSLSGHGTLLDRNLSTQSLEGERDELLSRLKARKATLTDYYALL